MQQCVLLFQLNSPNHLQIFKTTVMSIFPFIFAPHCAPIWTNVIHKTSSISRFMHKNQQCLSELLTASYSILKLPYECCYGSPCSASHWILLPLKRLNPLRSADLCLKRDMMRGYSRCSYTSSLLHLFPFPDSAFSTCFASNNKSSWPRPFLYVTSIH